MQVEISLVQYSIDPFPGSYSNYGFVRLLSFTCYIISIFEFEKYFIVCNVLSKMFLIVDVLATYFYLEDY